jgi:hypothetical protein
MVLPTFPNQGEGAAHQRELENLDWTNPPGTGTSVHSIQANDPSSTPRICLTLVQSVEK